MLLVQNLPQTYFKSFVPKDVGAVLREVQNKPNHATTLLGAGAALPPPPAATAYLGRSQK